MIKRNIRVSAILCGLLTVIVTAAFSQTQPKKDFPNIRIKNFGQMDENYYRGARPKKEDFQSLADLGVKTVIDLTDKPKDYEKPAVEALGMKYINIPMSDKSYPTEEAIATFLQLVNDPNTGTFFVHCAGGRHRTGVMGAVYRFNKYGWDYDMAYKEMKNYDFYTRWGHGAMKDFVIDYASKLKTAGTQAAEQVKAGEGNK
jgi:protein tyrosine/serine phosphatase